MPTQPSVFMIGWEYPPHNSGGLGVACEGMTQALSKAGHHISFTLPYDHSLNVSHMDVLACVDPSWETSHVPPFSVYQAMVKPVMTSLNPDNLRTVPESDLETKVEEYATQVYNSSKKAKKFDIIHAHDWLAFPAALDIKKKTGQPFVAHIHSTEYDRIPNGNGSRYIMATEKKGMELAERVIAVSDYTKQLLIKHYNINPAKIQVVHNGINPPQTDLITSSFGAGRPVIVFMGRLTEQKGGEYFLQLARNVVENIPDALFVIAGNGDLYQELLLSSAHKQLSAHVLFSGFIRDRQKHMLLNRANLFIMPSLSEPFGLVALEAAQRQTPVIISKNTGVAESLPSAIQVDFWDIDRMKAEVIRLLQQSPHARNQVTAQNNDIKALTWESSAQKIQQVYRNSFLGN